MSKSIMEHEIDLFEVKETSIKMLSILSHRIYNLLNINTSYKKLVEDMEITIWSQQQYIQTLERKLNIYKTF
jgi:hypothetical protein